MSNQQDYIGEQDTSNASSGAKEKVEDMFERMGKTFKKLVRGADQVVQVGKAKFDATKLYRERMNLFEHLGERCFHLIQAGKFSTDDVSDIIKRITQVNEQIQKQMRDEDDQQGFEAAAKTKTSEKKTSAAKQPQKAAVKKKTSSKKTSKTTSSTKKTQKK
ncbi:MAG: hypothetical protein KDD52_01615 [Bdellovibrionales bacterium]|nr:hypothetical protein [Bdellovibrionales bacterium]